MTRPSLQFYPGDWLRNANLRRCSPAARGVWLDVMCVLHDQDTYGIARWPLKDIAKAATASLVHIRELVDKNVLKGVEKGDCAPYVYVPRSGRKDGDPVILIPAQAGPIWYSSRMVRDEYVRTIRAESGATGASPKAAPKPPKGEPIGGGFGPRDSSSSSSPSVEDPHTPRGGRSTVSLKTWAEETRASGQKLIPDDDPVFDYATEVGIPDDFMALAWQEFKHRYTQPGAKRYKDWRAVFRKAVRGNWMKLWYLDGDSYRLTTVGHQATRTRDAA